MTTCPWCGVVVNPEDRIAMRKHAEVIERCCPKCGKILSAHLKDEEWGCFLNTRSGAPEMDPVSEG